MRIIGFEILAFASSVAFEFFGFEDIGFWLSSEFGLSGCCVWHKGLVLIVRIAGLCGKLM